MFLLKRYGPGSVSYYFYHEKKLLLIVTLSGILYNVGMIAGPWFDGQLAQYLYDIFGGTRTAADMYALCLCYALVILGRAPAMSSACTSGSSPTTSACP